MAIRRRGIQRPLRNKLTPTAFAIDEGLDLISDDLEISPGRPKDGINYVLRKQGGVERVGGYQLFDGTPVTEIPDPSVDLSSTTITNPIGEDTLFAESAGEMTLTALNGGTAKVSFEFTTVSGGVCTFTFDQPSAAINYTVGSTEEGADITAETDTGAGAKTNTVAFTAVGTKSYVTLYFTTATAQTYDTFTWATTRASAMDQALDVRAVFQVGTTWYAIQNNSGETAGLLFQESATGWTAVALGNRLGFDVGLIAEVSEGDSIVGVDSGASATVNRVVRQTGTWKANDAAGFFCIGTVTGGPFQAEGLTVSGTLSANATGAETAITLPAGGSYDVKIGSYYAGVTGRRAYGANGVGTAFEFDGTTFVPIETGVTPDTPNHVEVGEFHLMLGWDTGDWANSSTLLPTVFDAYRGADNDIIPDEIVEIRKLEGAGRTAFICRDSLFILSGDVSASWRMDSYTYEVGGIAGTAGMLGAKLFYLDDQGVTWLGASQDFGGYAREPVSFDVDPDLIKRKTDVTASLVSKRTSTYRLFYGTRAFYFTMKGTELRGIMPILLDDTVLCTGVGRDANGKEMLMFGSDGGEVFHMDNTSFFDFADIEAWIKLPFNFVENPLLLKEYVKAVIGMKVDDLDAFNLYVRVEYGQNDPKGASADNWTFASPDGGTPAIWAFANWAEFFWGVTDSNHGNIPLRGSDTSISFTFYSDGTAGQAHSINDVTFLYKPETIKV